MITQKRLAGMLVLLLVAAIGSCSFRIHFSGDAGKVAITAPIELTT